MALQAATRWVFENEREAEMRHILLATEFAVSGSDHVDAMSCIRTTAEDALDGAKIAYQLSLSELSRDTLKALTDLRKSVTDETAKLIDMTRQLAAAVAGALAVGLGLIAARLATAAYPSLIVAVMLVGAAYVTLVIVSGCQFVGLQRQLRRDWQPRLYRFLPTAEYDRMVQRPAGEAEKAFYVAAAIGGIATLGLTAAVIYFAVQFPSPATIGPSGPPSAANQPGPAPQPPSPPKLQQPPPTVPPSGPNPAGQGSQLPPSSKPQPSSPPPAPQPAPPIH